MKKAILVFALMVAGSMALAAQASGTAAQRLVGGTWTVVNGSCTFVFNADGTMTERGLWRPNDSNRTFVFNADGAMIRGVWRSYVHWAAIDDTIVMMPGWWSSGSSFQFRVSADGRTLILSQETSDATEGWIFRRN